MYLTLISTDYANLNATFTGHNLYLTTVLSKAYNEKIQGLFLFTSVNTLTPPPPQYLMKYMTPPPSSVPQWVLIFNPPVHHQKKKKKKSDNPRLHITAPPNPNPDPPPPTW